MSYIVPADFTRDEFDPGAVDPNFNAISPLVYDDLTKRLSILDASLTHNGVVSTTAQTFAGAKAFAAVPTCTIKPTTPDQLANKGYVDSICRGQSWMDPVIAFIDFVVEPLNPSNKDRHVAYGASVPPPFVENYIYEWDAEQSGWKQIIPTEGDALWVTSDTGPHANTQVVFDGSDWVSMGTTISHQALIGAGTLSHATIDSYLDQAVKSTSNPTFGKLELTDTTDSSSPTTGALVVAGGIGAGGAIRTTGSIVADANAQFSGNLTSVNGLVRFNRVESSTSTDTGTLVVVA